MQIIRHQHDKDQTSYTLFHQVQKKKSTDHQHRYKNRNEELSIRENELYFFHKDVIPHFLCPTFFHTFASKYKVSDTQQRDKIAFESILSFSPLFLFIFATQRQGFKHESQQVPNICKHIIIKTFL